MHLLKEKLTGHRRMRFIFIAVASFVLVVAPVSVSAQQAAQSASSGQITDANLLVAGTAIAVAVASIIGAIILAIVNNRLAIDKAQRDKEAADAKAERDKEAADAKEERDEEASKVQNLTELTRVVTLLVVTMDKQATASLQDRADANRDRKTILEIVETKDNAKAGRDEAVKTVNDHIDTTATTLREPLTQAVAALTSASDNVKTATESISQVVTSKELKAELKPILDMLDSLGESVGIVLRRLGTGPLNPAHVPASAPAPADSAGAANGGVPIEPKGAA